MRLIDADSLIEKLKSYAECDWNKSLCTMLTNVVDDCIEVVDMQQTAYSVDKVVEEMEKKSYTTTDTVCGGIFKAIRLSSAIEIVKQGGVSDDVCEWTQTQINNGWKPSCEPNSTYNVFGVAWFRKCPYCGKKIKVVGD